MATQTLQLDGHTVQEGSANRQLDAGNQAMRLSRNEFWATLDDVRRRSIDSSRPARFSSEREGIPSAR